MEDRDGNPLSAVIAAAAAFLIAATLYFHIFRIHDLDDIVPPSPLRDDEISIILNDPNLKESEKMDILGDLYIPIEIREGW